MISFNKANQKIALKQYFVNDYTADNHLIDATNAWYVKHETIKSPMGSNTAAFAQKVAAENLAKSAAVSIISWENIIQ